MIFEEWSCIEVIRIMESILRSPHDVGDELVWNVHLKRCWSYSDEYILEIHTIYLSCKSSSLSSFSMPNLFLRSVLEYFAPLSLPPDVSAALQLSFWGERSNSEVLNVFDKSNEENSLNLRESTWGSELVRRSRIFILGEEWLVHAEDWEHETGFHSNLIL